VSSSPPGVRLLLDEPRLRVGAAGSVLIAHWLAPPSAPEMRQMRTLIRPYVATHGAFCALNIVDIQHVAPMPEDARQEVAETQREFSKTQLGLANVIEGSGFWAASLRSVAAGLAFLSRVKFEQRIFDHVQPASVWLATLFPHGRVRPETIQRAAFELRVSRD
jgi:hypothetical protein